MTPTWVATLYARAPQRQVRRAVGGGPGGLDLDIVGALNHRKKVDCRVRLECGHEMIARLRYVEGNSDSPFTWRSSIVRCRACAEAMHPALRGSGASPGGLRCVLPTSVLRKAWVHAGSQVRVKSTPRTRLPKGTGLPARGRWSDPNDCVAWAGELGRLEYRAGDGWWSYIVVFDRGREATLEGAIDLLVPVKEDAPCAD